MTLWRWTALATVVVVAVALAWLWTPDRPRAALEARYAAPPSRFADVLGLRLHLRDTGPRDAQAVLFLHGFGASLHTWEDWATVLESDRRVLRIDLPGFGLTGADPSGDYSDERAIAVIAALLDQLGVARVDLVGSSMGGRIAWRFAAAEPARVRRLVLMAPDGFATDPERYGRAGRVPLLMQALPYTLPRRLLRGGMAPAYANPDSFTEETVDRYHAMMLAPGVRRAILDRMAGHVLPRPEPFLRGLAMPVLLLWGADDRMVPASHAADYASLLPDSRTVTLPGIGHVPMEEDPARALAPLREFLEAP